LTKYSFVNLKNYINKIKEKLSNAGISELLHNRKFVLSSVAIIAGLVLTTWLIIHFSFTAQTFSSAIDAVPSDAAVILEVKQPKGLWSELSTTSGVWAELKKTELFGSINKEITFLDSLFKTNECATSMMKENTLYVSMHAMAAGNTGFLYLTGLNKTCNESFVDEIIKKAIPPHSAEFDITFMGTQIKEISMPGRTEKFDYTISKNVFICSAERMLVESAIKQQKSGISVTKDAGFSKVAETTGKKVLADVYINFRYFSTLFSKLVAPAYIKNILSMASFADWSALDVSVKKDVILLNGFTTANDTANGFLSLFAGQEPHEMMMTDVLPSSTASFVYYGFSDFDKWYKSYSAYLKKHGTLNARTAAITKLNSDYKTDVEKNFTTWVGKEMALVVTEPADSDATTSMFAVIKADNINNAMTMLAPQSQVQTVKAVKPKKSEKDKKGKKKKTTPKMEEVKTTPTSIEPNKIYEYKIPGVIPVLFGKLFDAVKGNYYTIVNDYVIFANSSKALDSFLKDFADAKKLSDNNNYLSFAKNIATESNIYLYCNIRKSQHIFTNYAGKGIADYMSHHFDNFKNFGAFACQLRAEKKLFYSNICIKTTSSSAAESNALWSLKLDSAVFNKPQVVSDISDKSKKIIAFDNAANMYLIDKDGSLLWKIELKEKPLSDVFVIDYAKDGKSEYMFNTQNYIYLLDKEGKSVGDFPLHLSDEATAAMTVADFANTKDYNLYVPCGNKICNFTKTGAVNKNWTVYNTQSDICKEVTCLKFNGSDCLLTSDKEGNIYVLNKAGEQKIRVKNSFTASAFGKFYAIKGSKKTKSSILTTDNQGNLAFISASGNVDKKTVAKFSPNHYFLYEDFNNDKANEYIFFDENKLSIYDAALKLLYSYTFPVEIAGCPSYYQDADGNGMIGFVSAKTSNIYLLKTECTLSNGFPLTGSSPFSVSSLSNDGALNLIVGSERTVYNYAIE